MKFDILKDFNVFAHNEIIMKNADCEGVMAAHKNLELENYSVGVGFSPFECKREINSLVAGGKVRIKNSVNYNGNTCLQKNKFSNYYKMSNPSGRVVYRNLVDFEKCFNNCIFIQDFLKNQRANTVVECNELGRLSFKSLYKDEVHHFFVNSDDLNKAKVVNFDIDLRSLVFINVLGERVDFSGVSLLINNQKLSCKATRNMFWNFVDTSEICMNDIDFYGTIFSTKGDLKCVNSRVFGNVYSYNIYGNSDIYLCSLSNKVVRYLNAIYDNWDLNKEEHVEINEEIIKDFEIKEEVVQVESLEENKKHLNINNDTKSEIKNIEMQILKINAPSSIIERTKFEKSVNIYIENLNKIEESIGLLLNAEAIKYEKAIGLAESVDDHYKINKSLLKTLKCIKTMQLLVNERLDSVRRIEMMKKIKKSC